jgi:hypothetical protein
MAFSPPCGGVVLQSEAGDHAAHTRRLLAAQGAHACYQQGCACLYAGGSVKAWLPVHSLAYAYCAGPALWQDKGLATTSCLDAEHHQQAT